MTLSFSERVFPPMSDQPTAMLDALNEKNLKRLLQFTDDDLVANRAGLFSEAQTTRMHYEKESAKQVVAVVLFIMMIVGGILFIGLISQPYTSRSARSSGSKSSSGLACVVLPLVFIAPIFFQLVKTTEDLDTKKVMSIRGPIKRQKYRHRKGVYFRIISGDKKFEVSKPIHDAFVDDQTYVLFYTPTMRLIAAEHIPSSQSSAQTLHVE
jgi:hypothetical protein